MSSTNGGIITEMGVDFSRQGKTSYLGKAHEEGNVRKRNKLLVQDFTNLRWQDIGINYSDGGYYITLPEELIQKIRTLRAEDPQVGNSYGQWFQLDRGGVHMNMDGSTHRSHFPDGGIPAVLRGCGLGYKCYRRFLEYHSWLTSNTSGTTEKNNAWASMIKSRPDPDDVHAIVGPSNVFAMIKTLNVPKKIELATNFINQYIVPGIDRINADNFAMDDELRDILPEDLQTMADPVRREEVQRRRDAEAAVVAAREAAAQIERNRAIFNQFGIGEIDRNWVVGDFVIRVSHLTDTNVTVRVVVKVNNIRKAISLEDYIEWARNTLHYTPRTVRDLNDSWTKVNILNIPSTSDARLVGPAKNLIDALIRAGRLTAPVIGTEEARNLAIQALRQTEERRTNVAFGPRIPTSTYDTAEYAQLINNRTLRPESQRKIKQSNFITSIFLDDSQFERFQAGKSSEVLAGFNGTSIQMRTSGPNTPAKAINTITGFIVENPESLRITKFSLVVPRNKRDLRPGDMVYIESHPVFYGLTAKVGYSVLSPTTQIEYVFVEIFNPSIPGAPGRKVSIGLQFIRKMRREA